MLVAVTGGAGFIGTHVVRELAARGASVRVLDDLSTGRVERLRNLSNVELCVGDVREEAFVRSVFRGASHVMHLAAKVSVAASLETPRLTASHNIEGFISVLEAARKEGVSRLVYASSAAVYGVPATLPVAEEAPAAPISPYGVEKLTNEHYAAMYERLYGLPLLGMRFFNVYGPGQDASSPYSGVVSQFVHRVAAGGEITIYGDGLQSRDFISVRDVARASVALLHASATGVCNVATGAATSLNDLLRILESVTGRRLTVRHETARSGDIRHSQADTSRMRALWGSGCEVQLADGLAELLRAAQPAAVPVA